MKYSPRSVLPGILIFLFIISGIAPQSAKAAETLVFDNSTGTYGPWNQGTNDIYLNRITGTSGSVITTIKSGWNSGITTQASNNTVYLFSDVSNTPGSVVATFSYSSNDGSNWATYTGNYTVPAGGVFWIGQRATSTINNSGSSNTNQVSSGWSIWLGMRYYGTSLTGPFTGSALGTSPLWRIYTGAVATTLPTPSAPSLTSSSTTIGASETSTTTNASSYLIKLYASNGITLIDSKTATNSTITSGITFTGLTPNTNYKVGVIAVGDGVNYLDSSISSLTSINTSLGVSTVTTEIVGTPTQLTFRTTYQIRATTTGSTGYVAFKVNGIRISSCSKIIVSGSIANCNWKPSLRGILTITATFTSTNANYASSSANPLVLQVLTRSNRH